MKNFDYQKTKTELDELLAWFQSGEVSIDEAIAKYKRGEELLRQLEKYLNDSKIKVEKITKKQQS
jgi:exodeoxyribonuclease VII small subunit